MNGVVQSGEITHDHLSGAEVTLYDATSGAVLGTATSAEDGSSQYVLADTDAARDRAEATLRKLGVSDLNPTTMSRTSGELTVQVEGKPVKYVYSVRKRE